MDDLKSCPFCGHSAAIGHSQRNYATVYWVYCLKCHARSDNWFFEGKAREMWNRRVPKKREKKNGDVINS